VIRSVFVVELYAMIHEFDVDSVLKSILTKMLGLGLISLILVIDFKSLYDCLIRLKITVEKRLMIDVMALRQSYERREITEVKWINESNNPADSMIKVESSTALKTVIDTNRVRLSSVKWVERTNQTDEKKKTRLDETNWEKDQMNQLRKRSGESDWLISESDKECFIIFRDASVLISLNHDIIPHVASAHVTHNREHTTYSTVVYWIKHHPSSDSSTDAYWASGATSRGGLTLLIIWKM
jgi:hypothetical protein